MVSHARQVNFSRTVWITFHCRGITSSVSVIVSPSLASLPRQHGHSVGPGMTTRSRGKLKLPRFGGHPEAFARGVYNAEDPSSVFRRVSSSDGRVSPCRARSDRPGARV